MEFALMQQPSHIQLFRKIIIYDRLTQSSEATLMFCFCCEGCQKCPLDTQRRRCNASANMSQLIFSKNMQIKYSFRLDRLLSARVRVYFEYILLVQIWNFQNKNMLAMSLLFYPSPALNTIQIVVHGDKSSNVVLLFQDINFIFSQAS